MIRPKFAWNDGADHIMIPAIPATQKSGAHQRTATRYDNVTISGLVESCYQRTDQFLSLQFTYVQFSDYDTTDGGDSGWILFLAYAETGALFSYYPDSSLTTHNTYKLEDTDWNPQYTAHGYAKFNIKLRRIS